jgi:3-methyl-2-oxobutanoate hydroxymethyltransferase
MTVIDIMQKKGKEKIVMLTAYDYSMAKILESAGIDIILVGDSLSMVFKGEETTLGITLDEILYHTKAVAKAKKNALLVADMPFLSYKVNIEDALYNAGRLIKEGNADAVKLEGGAELVNTIKGLIDLGIPVMGHIGLTPQAIHKLGGYKVQGKDQLTREKLINDAKALETAGVFSIVLECIPYSLAKDITQILNIPTIGCGAGVYCDGQVLVLEDMIGLYPGKKAKFVREYLNLKELIKQAVLNFKQDVKEEKFPSLQESYE